MNIKYTNYPNGYIKVKELMGLPRPKHRSRFLVGRGEIIPIITVTTWI